MSGVLDSRALKQMYKTKDSKGYIAWRSQAQKYTNSGYNQMIYRHFFLGDVSPERAEALAANLLWYTLCLPSKMRANDFRWSTSYHQKLFNDLLTAAETEYQAKVR